MVITKDKKKVLLKQYVADLKSAGSTYMLNQNAIPVNVSTKIRKEICSAGVKMNVVRKRLFLKAVEEAGFDAVQLDDLSWSTLAIYAENEDFAPLKVIAKYNKEFKWAGNDLSSFWFLWCWSENKWKDSEYVTELANIPSKEELLSKLLWLLKYPIQSFACVLDQVSKKSA